MISSSDFLKLRYKDQILYPIRNFLNADVKSIEDESNSGISIYASLYKSGYSVFKNYPLFGVGNKNYRVETCVEIKKPNYLCNTHPHQIYFEFLSEHGFIGTIILLFVFFSLIFGKLKIILESRNYIQIGCCIFLFNLYIPFLPSGAFFGDYNFTIFWLNLSLMYALNKKTNIFTKS